VQHPPTAQGQIRDYSCILSTPDYNRFLNYTNRKNHLLNFDKLVKSRHEDQRWLDKKFDIQGVVFLAGSRQYIEYVEGLPKTYNEGDRAFYDAIKFLRQMKTKRQDIRKARF